MRFRPARSVSRIQKILLSIVGTVIGHLLLLVLVVLMLSAADLMQPAEAAAASEEEITIVLSDLMENIEVVPPAPEPELESPSPEALAYLETFADQESANAPDSAAFESDRNTLATSEEAPDFNSDRAAPTVSSELELDSTNFRNRQFVDGEFLERSASSPPGAEQTTPPQQQATPQTPAEQIGPPAPPKPPTPLAADTPPELLQLDPLPPSPSDSEDFLPDPTDRDATPDTINTDPSPADRAPETPAKAERMIADLPPATKPDDALIQPDAEMRTEQEPQIAKREAVFEDDRVVLDPAFFEGKLAREPQEAKALVISEEKGEPMMPAALPIPETAVPRPKTPDPFAVETPEPTPEQINTAPPVQQPTPPEQMAGANIPPSNKPPADETAFTAETHRAKSSGNIGNMGDTASFDAIATDTGVYKKAVNQAIQREFLRKRTYNSDLVNLGTVHIKFKVMPDGSTKKLSVIKNDAGVSTAEILLRSVSDAEFPEMPAAVADFYQQYGLEIDFRLIVF